MTRIFALLVFFSVVTVISCTSAKTNHSMPMRIAWNEDTVNSYLFIVQDRQHFSYRISKNDGLKETRHTYSGVYTYVGEKLILYFQGEKPAELAEYLVFEASGNYLIQYFTNNKKRLFLRIRSNGRHSWML